MVLPWPYGSLWCLKHHLYAAHTHHHGLCDLWWTPKIVVPLVIEETMCARSCQAKAPLHKPLHNSWLWPRAVGRLLGCLYLWGCGVIYVYKVTSSKTTGTTMSRGALDDLSKWVWISHMSMGGKVTLPRCYLHNHELHHDSWSWPRIVGADVVFP